MKKSFLAKIRKFENCIYHSECDIFPTFRSFLDEISSNINKCGFLVLSWNTTCQHLEVLHSSGRLCIMFQNHLGLKDPFKVQARQVDFNVIKKEMFTDTL